MADSQLMDKLGEQCQNTDPIAEQNESQAVTVSEQNLSETGENKDMGRTEAKTSGPDVNAALEVSDKLNDAEKDHDDDADEVTCKLEEQQMLVDGAEEEDEDREEEDEEEEDVAKQHGSLDPNVIPQVNVSVLAKRQWQVKVYPLKTSDFISGQIYRVFSKAKESLLYLLNGKYSRGKGEMYTSSVNQTLKVVQNLMKLDFHYPEINIEVIRKNDEGTVEEKGYLRFDTKLVRMLNAPQLPPRGGGSRRERIIGSVFVKNLPNNTSKDMLRIMFPFAPEINYNPEKYKDGTARLVLNNRSAVLPCLKAFAKIELGGNILELHPLEKRKRQRDRSGKPKELDQAEANNHIEAGNIKEESNVDENVTCEDKEASESAQKEDEKTQESKKETPKKSQEANNPVDDNKKSKAAAGWLKGRKGLFGGQERRRSGAGAVDNKTGGPGRGAKPQGDKDHGSRDRRQQQERNRGNRRNRGGWVDGGYGVRRSAARNRYGSAGVYGGRNFDGRGLRGFGAEADMSLNSDATQEMMLLQSQLSMAIKNQLSMLNQTQLAVEQAKRGAGVYNMTSLPDLTRHGESSRDRRYGGNRSRSRERGLEEDELRFGGFGYKRTVDMTGLQDDYGSSSFGKRRSTGLGAQDIGWPDERNDLYSQQHQHQQQQQPPLFGYGLDKEGDFGSRGFGAGNYGYQY